MPSFLCIKCQASSVKKGFTLVELLVVLGLLSATVASTLIFLTSSLKGANQAAVTGELKQNGQVIMDQLERQIRGAASAKIVAADSNLMLSSPTGTLHIRCFAPVRPTLNGYIGTSTDPSDAPGAGTYTSLTNNTDLISGINVETCSLTVPPASAGGLSPAVVAVSFTLTNGISADTLRPDLKGSAYFQTTISLRQSQ
ncbi:prepilin-type N-terminal cleavage/methylation domain-containing protein [Candidatus Curtissbacteria bacterium]|nr:prepilin-type N-terminal cleavage/methylation domain-containing protein [Candidatus Curtissbacteria bacterium]